jgi:hypothetical protein
LHKPLLSTYALHFQPTPFFLIWSPKQSHQILFGWTTEGRQEKWNMRHVWGEKFTQLWWRNWTDREMYTFVVEKLDRQRNVHSCGGETGQRNVHSCGGETG